MEPPLVTRARASHCFNSAPPDFNPGWINASCGVTAAYANCSGVSGASSPEYHDLMMAAGTQPMEPFMGGHIGYRKSV